jgi:predicted RNA binding protein YcfA (HicA-like mRNA interferase family)
MPTVKPVKRAELIHYLRRLGFTGPFSGGKHQFMIKENVSVTIPNPHHEDIGKELLKRILQQADISLDEWKAL